MNMANSDYIIYELLKKHNGSQLRFEDIQSLAPVPLSKPTVQRVIKRLIATGQIERVVTGRKYIRGSKYVIIK